VISGNSLRILGWTFTALLTPFILLITSIGFFGIYFMKDSLHAYSLVALGVSPLMLIVLIGALQNILARGAKYTVFDLTKEMAFVPLGITSKLKGQAAIDGVCNRFGKSGGSMIHQSLLFVFATFSASSPYIFSVLLVIIAVWMGAVWLLGKEFNLLTAPIHQEEQKTEGKIPEIAEQWIV
jgi:AAA family ATP:ADP antiporter